MHRNYQKYKKINTEQYSKRIKNSFFSIVSISIGLLFTYLAMTKPEPVKNKVKINFEDENNDYNYISLKTTLSKPEDVKLSKDKHIRLKENK